jgi:hypothetical protein
MESEDRREGTADEVAKGAGGAIAGNVLGTSMGGNTAGSLAGALTGQAAADDLVDTPPEEEELPPIDMDAVQALNKPDRSEPDIEGI